jgi:hypothetical protein
MVGVDVILRFAYTAALHCVFISCRSKMNTQNSIPGIPKILRGKRSHAFPQVAAQ